MASVVKDCSSVPASTSWLLGSSCRSRGSAVVVTMAPAPIAASSSV